MQVFLRKKFKKVFQILEHHKCKRTFTILLLQSIEENTLFARPFLVAEPYHRVNIDRPKALLIQPWLEFLTNCNAQQGYILPDSKWNSQETLKLFKYTCSSSAASLGCDCDSRCLCAKFQWPNSWAGTPTQLKIVDQTFHAIINPFHQVLLQMK